MAIFSCWRSSVAGTVVASNWRSSLCSRWSSEFLYHIFLSRWERVRCLHKYCHLVVAADQLVTNRCAVEDQVMRMRLYNTRFMLLRQFCEWIIQYFDYNTVHHDMESTWMFYRISFNYIFHIWVRVTRPLYYRITWEKLKASWIPPKVESEQTNSALCIKDPSMDGL